MTLVVDDNIEDPAAKIIFMEHDTVGSRAFIGNHAFVIRHRPYGSLERSYILSADQFAIGMARYSQTSDWLFTQYRKYGEHIIVNSNIIDDLWREAGIAPS